MTEELIIDEKDRYGRFRLISWWDQEKLRAAKVMVVGAGALGNEVLKNLALLGVGHVFIVDYDTIESTNLTRSVLYRASDEGRPKVERAAAAVSQLNPDVRVRPCNGNVITDVGLGVFGEMDVVIGCLDNREARLWINRQCWKANKPWVDGAIQEISGVVKVFCPPDSACYECAMTEMDYKLINLKYSCPLLRREDVAEGKVPTAPTISSVIAGLQTQEALKILHGLKVASGAAMVFNGEANNFYITHYQRRSDCLSHETYPPVRDISLSSRAPVEELFRKERRGTLLLDRDFLVDLSCPPCKVTKEVGRPLASVGLRDGMCPSCRGVMRTNIVHRIEPGSPLASRPLRSLGVAPYDVVKVANGREVSFFRLAGDRSEVMAWA